MNINEDKKLKQFVEKIAYHCRDNNYQMILAIKTERDEDGQIISCYGGSMDIVANILMFVEQMEGKTNVPLFKILKMGCEMSMANEEKSLIVH